MRVLQVVLGPPQSFTCRGALSAWPWQPRRPAPPPVLALSASRPCAYGSVLGRSHPSSGGPIHPRVCAGEVSSGCVRGRKQFYAASALPSVQRSGGW